MYHTMSMEPSQHVRLPSCRSVHDNKYHMLVNRLADSFFEKGTGPKAHLEADQVPICHKTFDATCLMQIAC